MARIYPFRALRYDTSRVHMEDVVTQPYDKITPEMQQRYYEQSPFNLCRIVLGKPEPGDDDHENVYTRARGYLHDWRAEGILAEESEPALYGYSQTYTVPGSNPPETRERRGFIALGHLYPYSAKVVYRHEQTFPKHKSDRLALFKATRAYCEQIYMLYSDPAMTAEKLIFGDSGGTGASSPPDLSITDEYGVIHRLWRLADPGLINLITTAMADKKLLIADGHHRYETSLSYAEERSAQLHLPFNVRSGELESPSVRADLDPHPQLPEPPFPEAAMMMTFVNMDAPGITILPTHRVLEGLENFSSPDFITRASAFYTVTELPDEASAADLLAHLEAAAAAPHCRPLAKPARRRRPDACLAGQCRSAGDKLQQQPVADAIQQQPVAHTIQQQPVADALEHQSVASCPAPTHGHLRPRRRHRRRQLPPPRETRRPRRSPPRRRPPPARP